LFASAFEASSTRLGSPWLVIDITTQIPEDPSPDSLKSTSVSCGIPLMRVLTVVLEMRSLTIVIVEVRGTASLVPHSQGGSARESLSSPHLCRLLESRFGHLALWPHLFRLRSIRSPFVLNISVLFLNLVSPAATRSILVSPPIIFCLSASPDLIGELGVADDGLPSPPSLPSRVPAVDMTSGFVFSAR